MSNSYTVIFLQVIFLSFFIACSEVIIEPEYPETEVDPEFDPEKHGDHFVAPWGKDMGPGTYDDPWATWQRAFEMAIPGDTIYFRGGVYMPEYAWYDGKYYNCIIQPESDRPRGNNGVPGNPICYFAYPGEIPIMDCSLIEPYSNFLSGINLMQVSYLHFKGLVIRNVFQTRDNVECFGISANDCSNITFQNMTIHNISGNAFRFGGAFGYLPGITSDTTRFINCDAYNCSDSRPREPGATVGGAADGFKTWNEPGSYFIFDGCRAWNNSDDGFDLGTDAVTVIRNCWSFRNGYLDGDGSGFKTGGMHHDNGSLITRIVTNNIATENSSTGFFLLEYEGYYRTNARIYNNFFYKNGGAPFFSQNAEHPKTLSVWRNNISYAHPKDEFGNAYQEYSESHNSWDYVSGSYPGWVYTDTVTVTDEDFVSLDVNQLDDLRKPDGSLPDITFGHLVEGSDLIGAGTYVGMSQNPAMGIDWEYIERKNSKY